MIKNLLTRITTDKYFSSWLILLIDLGVSAAASLMVLYTEALFYTVHPGLPFMTLWIAGAMASSLAMFLILRTYKAIVRYSTLREIGRLLLAVTGKEVMMCLLLLVLRLSSIHNFIAPWKLLLLDFSFTFGALIVMRVAMIAVYDALRYRLNVRRETQRVLIYGISEKSFALYVRLHHSEHYKVAGFLTYGKEQKGHLLQGLPVYYFEKAEDLKRLRHRLDLDAVLFAYYLDAREESDRLINYSQECGLKNLIAPSIDEITGSSALQMPVRKIKIEDLLGRPEIKISMDEIESTFRGKTILVTGAAGSIGSELCRQLARFGTGHLVMFDNAETPLHNLRLEFEDNYPDLKFTPIVGDVRIAARLDFVFRNYKPQIVFHAAAYKHVPLMEENPCEAVAVNVAGSRNVADKCIEYEAEKMVMISTDKAVNPTNIMGCTKRLAEIYVQSLGLAVAGGKVAGKTKFVTTRFGNVLGSNGSVIPRFREQIAHGGPVTVTHPEITRFFMTIPEACRLVMEAATISTGNQICVFDMGESVKIAHLAKQMIQLAGFTPDKDIKIEYTGLRPGEKLYEEVLATAENTLPTSHDRIRIAKVREYEYDTACEVMSTLSRQALEVNIPDMVRLMKRVVPEFKSVGSRFEEYDTEIAAETETV